MFSQQENKLSKEETVVEKIYRLAKEKDESALMAIVKAGVCLGVYQGECNAIMLLAKEGDSESVDFLIDKFKASHNHAVQGYAWGGHVKQVKEQIEQGASRDNAACGYAMGGHIEQVNQLIEQGASINSVMIGYAQGGHVEQVNELIRKGVSRDYAACGYARGGHVEQVDKQIEQGANLTGVVIGYAYGGYVKELTEQKFYRYNNTAVNAYARGGHVEQVNKLIEQGANRVEALFGYAHGGHVEQVNKLIEQEVCRDSAVIIDPYEDERYHENHTQRFIERLELRDSLDSAVRGFSNARYLHKKNVLRLMSCIDDEKLRELLAIKTSESYPSLDVPTLQERATRLNKIMREHQLDFKQAKSLMIEEDSAQSLQGSQIIEDRKASSKSPSPLTFPRHLCLWSFSEEKNLIENDKAEDRHQKGLSLT